MANMIEGANIYLISDYGGYGVVSTGDQEVPIQLLAICRYDDDELFYLFACDKDRAVIADTVHRSIADAVLFAQDYYEIEISWRQVT